LKYLLDTCTISELIKLAPNTSVKAWFNNQADVDLCLSVVTIGEIRKGIEAARPRNLSAALRYENWLDGLVRAYADRILPFDEPAAQVWGKFMALVPNSGVEDAMIAAIAAANGMGVATRNVIDFTPFGIPVFDPF